MALRWHRLVLDQSSILGNLLTLTCGRILSVIGHSPLLGYTSSFLPYESQSPGFPGLLIFICIFLTESAVLVPFYQIHLDPFMLTAPRISIPFSKIGFGDLLDVIDGLLVSLWKMRIMYTRWLLYGPKIDGL